MAQHSSDIYPVYSAPERWADGIIHALGIIGSIGATAVLLNLTPMHTGILLLYGLIMVTAFTASAAYHMTPWEQIRPTLRRFDHATIFLKIAGTYTPLVVLIGTTFSYVILAIVWAIALFGVAKKLFFWSRPGMSSTLLYLGMGWLSVTLAWPMIQALPTSAAWLIAAGGLTYTVGVIFYKWESLKFSNAIWHGFVLSASACFFAAILISELA
ncbi:PAQR family membrane homeostasis protein TrhA [Algirhabdus cladophorae]|uniref:PAQR family membrane homeostasis protein TrhA n=1 Tax=Algirhabdus cladophorae TaxID=3377108 RepID=UPI003B8452A1